MLIGIAGPARVGKDTVGALLPGPRLAFADALKDEACGIGKIDRDTLEARKAEIRFFLEALGKFHRIFEPDHWIGVIRKRWHEMAVNLDAWAKITDVRHRNEAEWIHSEGGMVFFLYREEIRPASEHEAKNLEQLQCLDYVKHISNNGTPEQTAQLIRDHFSPLSRSIATDIAPTPQQTELQLIRPGGLAGCTGHGIGS